MIKYLGSKRTLLPQILGAIKVAPRVRTVIDLFSGTARVGHALKQAGYRVLANDHNAYACTLSECYVAADAEDVLPEAEALVSEMNQIKGKAGYFTATYCEQSRFFKPKNGARVDAIRDEIERKGLSPDLKSVLLVSLMEAADRVDSTCGVQMAYLKSWAPRASNDLSLRVPRLLQRASGGKGAAYQMEAAAALQRLEGDLVYLDPPYNQHKYIGNYHIWETLVLWDKPEVYGVACKRIDCRERRSDFNSKPRFLGAFRTLLENVKAPNLLVSFSNEGYLDRDTLVRLLEERGHVSVVSADYKRYVGAQIGIYNPAGVKVGRVSHLRNKEFLFLVTPDKVELPDDLESLASIGQSGQRSLFSQVP